MLKGQHARLNATFETVGAIPPYMLRLRRKESFWTRLCVLCVRWSARTTHTNVSYNLWSPQATHLYGDIAPTVTKDGSSLPLFRFTDDRRWDAAHTALPDMRPLPGSVSRTERRRHLPDA